MAGRTMVNEEPSKTPQSLGLAGLALHYANVINQIDNIVSILLFCDIRFTICIQFSGLKI